MASDIEIRIIAKDGATQIIRGVSTSLDGLEGSAKRAGIALANSSGKEIAFKELIGDAGKLDRTVKATAETVSLSRREFSALAVTGVAAFNQIMASAGQTDDRVSKLAQGIANIGIGFAFGGPIGAGIAALGMAVGFVIDEIHRADAAAAQAKADLVAPFEAAKKSLDELAPSTDQFAANLQKILNVSPATAQSIENLAKADATYRDSLKQTIDLQEQAISKQNDLDTIQAARNTLQAGAGLSGWDAITHVPAELQAYLTLLQHGAGTNQAFEDTTKNLTSAVDDLSVKSEHAASVAIIHANAENERAIALDYAAAAALRLADALGDTRKETIDEQRGDMRAYAEYKTEQEWGDKVFIPGRGWVSQAQLARETKAQQEWLAQQKQFMSQIRGLVESVMGNTSVEDRLKRSGDAWDEFDLRLKAKLTGTNTAERAWGADFEKTLAAVAQATGLSMQEIQNQFESGALFSNKNVLGIKGLIDWGAVVGDTATAVNQIIGNYNKVSAGVQAYLNSDEAKAQMPNLKMALGLDPTAAAQDVQQALTSAMGGITGGGAEGKPSTFTTKLNFDSSKAKSDAETLKTLIAQIPASVAGTTVTTIQDLKKSAGFDETLETIIADINRIPELLDAEVTIVYRAVNPPPASAGTGVNSDSHPGKASGGYVDKGLYWLGEAGREYVLPAPMVRWIESILGGPIRDPRQLEWLFGAFGRGKQETRNQLAMWAAGVTGSMTQLPDKADKWLDKSYAKFQATYGMDTSGASASGGGGGGGGAGGGGGLGGDGETLSVLRHMDGTLLHILNALGGRAEPREKPQLNSSFSTFIPLAANGFS